MALRIVTFLFYIFHYVSSPSRWILSQALAIIKNKNAENKICVAIEELQVRVHGNRAVVVSIFVVGIMCFGLFGCGSGGNQPVLGSGTPSTGVNVTFKNMRPDQATVPAFVSFGGGGTLIGTNNADGSALTKGTSYSLSSLSQGVNITTYDSGRIYISLQNQLTTPNAGNGYAPNFNNPNLGDFATRWDKVEVTIAPGPPATSGGANLTSQDFFGLPLSITTSGGTQTPANLTWRTDTATVFQTLGALSNFNVITVEDAARAIAVGDNITGVEIPGVSAGKVVRVISPGSVAPINAAGQTVYASLAGYVSYLQTGNPTTPGQPVQTMIVGNNGQISKGGPFQMYNLTATISNKSYTVNGMPVSPGDLIFNGNINSGSGDVLYTIQVLAADLSDSEIYGANPQWKTLVPSDPNQSDPYMVVEKVIADYFAALNFGFAGSQVTNTNMPPTTIGASPSWTWYGNQPSGQATPKLPIAAAFAGAQPQNTGRYNLYAAYLVGVTDSYGFAYNDRLELPLAPLSDGSTMQITILPDTPTP